MFASLMPSGRTVVNSYIVSAPRQPLRRRRCCSDSHCAEDNAAQTKSQDFILIQRISLAMYIMSDGRTLTPLYSLFPLPYPHLKHNPIV